MIERCGRRSIPGRSRILKEVVVNGDVIEVDQMEEEDGTAEVGSVSVSESGAGFESPFLLVPAVAILTVS